MKAILILSVVCLLIFGIHGAPLRRQIREVEDENDLAEKVSLRITLSESLISIFCEISVNLTMYNLNGMKEKTTVF